MIHGSVSIGQLCVNMGVDEEAEKNKAESKESITSKASPQQPASVSQTVPPLRPTDVQTVP